MRLPISEEQIGCIKLGGFRNDVYYFIPSFSPGYSAHLKKSIDNIEYSFKQFKEMYPKQLGDIKHRYR